MMAVSTCTLQLAHRVWSYGRVTAFNVGEPPYVLPGGNPVQDPCVCNTVVYNLLSACSACQGSRWPTCVDRLLFSLRFPSTTFNTCQLHYVFIQPHPHGDWRNVSPKSTLLLAHMLSLRLPPQLPLARPSWDPSTPVGIHRHICGYLPSPLHFLSLEISSTVRYVPSQGDTWNVSAAQAKGGAIGGPLHAHIFTCLVDYPEVTGTSSVVPTSTTQALQSSVTPGVSSGSSSTSTSQSSSLSTSTPQTSPSSTATSQSSSNAGAITGGIVGGIVGVALITGVVAWFVVRRRRARSPPSDTDRGIKMGQLVSVPTPPTIETPTFYVSDSFFPFPQQQ